MTTTIWELVVEPPPGAEAAVEEWLDEIGSMGVVWEDAGTTPVFSSQDSFQRSRLKGYLRIEAGQREELDVRLRLHLARTIASTVVVVRWQELGEQDWQEAWKRHWHPIPVGRRLLVLPSWLDPAADEARLILRIDPGMAFGSGSHETTRGCLEALERVAAADGLGHLLDVGTGSGILALAALRLGAGRVTATDCDPVAVATCRENFACQRDGQALLRRLDLRILSQVPEGPFQTVVANLLAPVLLDMAVDLVKALTPGGTLILSGILAEQAPEVAVGFRQAGLLGSMTRWDLGEWVVWQGMRSR